MNTIAIFQLYAVKALEKAAEYYWVASQFSGYRSLYPLTSWIMMEIVVAVQKHQPFSDTETEIYRGYPDRVVKQSPDINSSDPFPPGMGLFATLCYRLIHAAIKGRKRMLPVGEVINRYQ